MNHASFTPQSLASVLTQNNLTGDCVIAYSGGLDSHVLLHALNEVSADLSLNLMAVHIHHGLSDAADQWAVHCQTVCRDLDVPIQVIRVNAQPAAGDSPEAAARRARYEAFAHLLGSAQTLVTAHHMGDQAETLLLRLLRGTGLNGMAAMPVAQSFANGRLLRPLLSFERATLSAYARIHELRWIEDISNEDLAFDRNYLRHRVMPLLKARWPAVERTFARAATNAAETAGMADMLARQDRIKAEVSANNSLDMAVLGSLSAERRRNVLRTWIRDRGFTVPSSRVLQRVEAELFRAGQDRNPLVAWSGAELRCYRQRLFLLPPLPPFNPEASLVWQPPTQLILALGSICCEIITQGGLDPLKCQENDLHVRFRRGGEKLRPAGRKRTISLKNLLQEHAVPPWLRDYLPLVYANDRLIAVAGIAIDEDWRAAAGTDGYWPVWQLPADHAPALTAY